MRAKAILMLMVVLAFFGCSGSGGEPTGDVSLDESYYTDLYGWNDDGGLTETLLGRGINMGNYLEAPVTSTYPMGEGSWTGGRLIRQSDFTLIKNAGFVTVRIPVRWSDHTAESAPYTIDTSFMNRVKEVVSWAHGAGLKVVLNVHHYEEMMNDGESAQAGHIERLDAIWDQICDEFPLSTYGEDELVFELLNEPNGTIGYDDWDSIIETLTTTIWTTNSITQNTGGEQRKIMIGTANWGGVPGLYELDLPAECNASNTIITIHYYEPFHFTHQGASWVDGADAWKGTEWLGTTSEQAPLLGLFSDIETWNTAGYEVFMGEFGVFSQYSDPDHQQAWTAFIAREAEERNISWAYWEFSSGFGAYDPATDQWRPQLINGLIPADVE